MRKLVEYLLTTPMTDDFKLTLLKNAVSGSSTPGKCGISL
jgi:hypothetical protein